jgi:hypothetical protein
MSAQASTCGTDTRGHAGGPDHPAARAAHKAFRLSVLLGALSAASVLVVFTRLLAAWRLASPASSARISVLGQQLTYPSANIAAIVVTILAAGGLVMAASATLSLSRELIADRRFRHALERLSTRSFEGACVIEDDRPQAFCAGLLRPRVYISSGALALLDAPSRAAVLAHERNHARRRDALRLACGRSVAAALFAIPGLRGLAHRQHELAELGADEAALMSGAADRAALAAAMLEFSRATGGGGRGVAAERVDHLLGASVRARLPLAAVACAASSLTLVIGLSALGTRGATGSATLAVPLLSSRPCIVMLGILAVAALAVIRRTRLRRTLPSGTGDESD